MCGIVGLLDATQSGFYNQERQVFFGMMLLNSFRGTHSTGALGLDKDNRTDILKCLRDPYQWNQWDVSEEFMNRMLTRYWAVVGHGRSATQGKIIPANAHPFIQGDITLVHNGTLTNLVHLNAKHKTTFDVDSELITYLINKEGLKETLNQIDGAYCLVWTDFRDGSVNMIRNHERPLEIGTYHSDNRLAFASEKHVLKWASEKGTQIKSIASLPANELWTFKRENGVLKKTVVSMYKSYTSFPHNTGYQAKGSYYGSSFREDLMINGKEYTEGDDVRFTVLDVVENVSHNRPSYISIKGTAVNDTKVQVVANLDMSQDDFLKMFPDETDEMIMIAKIKSYVELSSTIEFDFRIFTHQPRVYPEIKKDLESLVAAANKVETTIKDTTLMLPPPKKESSKSTSNVVELKAKDKDQKVMVKTVDGTYISTKRFSNFAQMGCKICQNHPTIEEAGGTLIFFRPEASGWEVYCPTCVTAHNHDINNLHMKAKH